MRVADEPRNYLIEISVFDAQLFEPLHVPECLCFDVLVHDYVGSGVNQFRCWSPKARK